MKNAHIVPRTYLENFASDGRIGVYQVVERKTLVLSVANVGTRFRFYERERPDGTPINDIEWSLGHGEAVATPVLRAFADLWPLTNTDKHKLAMLFAYQLLRGPRFKDEYEGFTQRFIDEYKSDAKFTKVDEEQMAAFDRALMGDSYRLIRMLAMGTTLTSILASMHWTLVEFRSPVVATSDHPVVLWPGGVASRSPQFTPLGVGALDCLEVRLPLSPRHAVLMTWLDDEDSRVRGTRQHAAHFNAFTIASAERQWFHLPAATPPTTSGSLLPLSHELVPVYSASVAASSVRRAKTSQHVQEKTGRDLHDQEVAIVSVTRSEPV